MSRPRPAKDRARRREYWENDSGRTFHSKWARASQLPVLLRAGEAPAAEWQSNAVVGRVEARNAGRGDGDKDFRAGTAGMIGQRQAERGRGLVRRHAKRQRYGV